MALDVFNLRNSVVDEYRSYVESFINILDPKNDWFANILEERGFALADSHDRLRAVVSGEKLSVSPYPPPDIIGCYVLVPTGGS